MRLQIQPRSKLKISTKALHNWYFKVQWRAERYAWLPQRRSIYVKDDFFPIVISIETVYPEGYKGRGKKNIQFTYGAFQKDGQSIRYKFLKQKLLYNNQIMDLNDIYGVDNAAANLADESQKECVVCYTTNKDTVVLPCRHMCLCIDCSQIVRMQTNKCPICRTTVSSFLQIKYDIDLKKV